MNAKTCKRLLLVDDDEFVSRTVKEVLELHGYHVDTSNNPVSALELARTNTYATVISDIKMPEISGLELLVQLHEVCEDLPVILMSAHADLDTAIEAIKKGAFDFILKPYRHEQLLSIVERATDKFSWIQDEKQAFSRLEETVSQSAQDWESTFNTITDMITIHDRYFNIIFANKAAKDALGLSSFIPGTLKCCKQYHGTDAPPPGCPSCSSLTTGKPVNFETFEPHLNKHLEFRAIPRINGNNEVIGLIHIVRDITERKKSEDKLREAQKAALKALRVKSEFLANMSHEIRTPMNGVIGMLDLLLGTEISRQQREYLGMCRSSAQAMLRLLNDILDASKIEANRLELDQNDFSLRHALKASIQSQLVELHRKGLKFLCAAPSDVPDLLIGDAGRLRQIITNLVNNAIKFTRHGEVSISVSVDDRDERSIDLRFAVRDTGIGIQQNRLNDIFESFRQADNSTTREYGGTGLGLSIVKSLAELMGGRVWVESELGKGSTFYLTARFGLSHAEITGQEEHLPIDWTTWSETSGEEQLDTKPVVFSQIPAACGGLSVVREQIHKLNEAVALRSDAQIEKCAGELKDCAAFAKLGRLSDDAFRIQLAARKGDIEQAAALFARFGPEWAEQNRGEPTAGPLPSLVKR